MHLPNSSILRVTHLHTMSDHIPPEVVTNILQRLSVKDLVRCRRVSKQWLAIIDSPQFIRSKLQSSMSTTSNAALFLQPMNDANLLWWREDHSSSGPVEYHSDTDQALLFGSCHGLICFARFRRPHDLLILNPSTGERHVFDGFLGNVQFNKLGGYGFGYDEISQGYKVVLVTEIDRHCGVKIYAIRQKSPSVAIPTTTTMPWYIARNQNLGVFFGGALHWLTIQLSMSRCTIQAVDLATETIRSLPMPPYLSSLKRNGLNIGVVYSCFCVCDLEKNAEEIGIWVMKEYGRVESWTKIFTIYSQDSVPRTVIPLGSNGGRILLSFANRRFVWCDPGKDLVVEAAGLSIGVGIYGAVYCVESLVKLFRLEVDDHEKDEKYYRVMEVKRKEHEEKLLLQDQEEPAALPRTSLPDGFDFELLVFDEFSYEDYE